MLILEWNESFWKIVQFSNFYWMVFCILMWYFEHWFHARVIYQAYVVFYKILSCEDPLSVVLSTALGVEELRDTNGDNHSLSVRVPTTVLGRKG